MKALLLVVALVLGTGLLTGAPAGATTTGRACAPGHGVTVVVDGRSLGPTRVACARDGGGHLAEWLFTHTGSRLTWVERDPSFVCRIDGKPSDQACVNDPPANAYWSLWIADGHSGWQYASIGARGLTVPSGGSVAFVWNTGGGHTAPDVPAPRSLAHPSASSSVTGAPTVQRDLPANEQPSGHRGGSGVPGWIPPAVIGLLIVAIAGVSMRRRKET